MSSRISISDKFTFGRLIRFALPSIVMVIFTSLYGIVDGVFVSNFTGDDAFTAVNLFLPIFYIVGSLGMLLGSGGCALVAKLFGEKNDDEARKVFSGLVIVAAAVAIVITLSTVWFLPQISVMLGAKGKVADDCTLYGTIMTCGLLPFSMQNFFQYWFAVADRPKLGLWITVAAGVTNALGDFVFMYAFKMGVSGAAIATVIGECVGGIVPLIWFLSKKGKNLYMVKPAIKPNELGKVCLNGSSEFLTSVSVSAVSILYNFQLLKYFGNAGVVAYGVIMYVSFVFIGCFLGFAVGTAPIVGYNYGAQNADELKSVFKKSLLFYGIAAIIMTAISEALATPLAMIFVSYDAELLALSVTALRIFSFSFLVSGFGIYASAFFTALNNGIISAVISTARTLVFQTVAVFVMPLIFGVHGIWGATIAAEFLSLILAAVFIITKRKKYGYI